MIKKHIFANTWEFYIFQMLPLNMCSVDCFINLHMLGRARTFLNWSTFSEHDRFETRLHHWLDQLEIITRPGQVHRKFLETVHSTQIHPFRDTLTSLVKPAWNYYPAKTYPFDWWQFKFRQFFGEVWALLTQDAIIHCFVKPFAPPQYMHWYKKDFRTYGGACFYDQNILLPLNMCLDM